MLLEKIKAAIKAKFPTVKLSTKRLEEIASKIETKLAGDETQIDAQIDAFNDYNPIENIAKTDDTIAGLKGRLKTASQTPPKKTETEPGDDPIVDPADPATAPDPVLALLREMKQEIATLKGDKIKETYAERAKKDFADIPAIAWEGRTIPTTEEEYAVFVTGVKDSYAKHVKESTEQGVAALSMPRVSQSSSSSSNKMDAGLKSFLEKQNNEAKAVEAQKSPFIIR